MTKSMALVSTPKLTMPLGVENDTSSIKKPPKRFKGGVFFELIAI